MSQGDALLWLQVLERGQEISKRDWRVVRVAIVELRQQTYIGRLFFGDDNGVVMWDCDCRPSDGCWLALKAYIPATRKQRPMNIRQCSAVCSTHADYNSNTQHRCCVQRFACTQANLHTGCPKSCVYWILPRLGGRRIIE